MKKRPKLVRMIHTLLGAEGFRKAVIYILNVMMARR